MDAPVTEPRWYLFDGRAPLGPMSAGQLTSALLQLPNPRRGLVWREDLPAWTEAGALPEMAAVLPPACAAPPPATMGPVRDSASGPSAQSVDELERTAALYRRLVQLAGGLLLLVLLLMAGAAMLPPVLAAFVTAAGQLTALGVWIAMATVVYRLAARLELTAPRLWAIATCIPVLNLVVLVMLSREARRWCERHGVVLGLFGPVRGSLDWMRD